MDDDDEPLYRTQDSGFENALSDLFKLIDFYKCRQFKWGQNFVSPELVKNSEYVLVKKLISLDDRNLPYDLLKTAI